MTYQGTMACVTTSQVKKLDTASIREPLISPLDTIRSPTHMHGNMQLHRYVCASVMWMPSLRQALPCMVPDAGI